MTLRVGFIGLGVMGLPMSKNLLNGGYPVVGYDLNRKALDELVEAGGQDAASPRDVARLSDVTITMLPDSPDVEKVVMGPGGVAEGAGPGSIVADMSTISPRVTRVIAARLKEQQVDFLDAPVSGGQPGAIAASLSIMVGGDERAFERCRPVLEKVGKRVTYMGASGAGQTTKLCNQIVGLVNLLAACEGLLFAARNGLDLQKVLEVVGAGAAGSWQWTNVGACMVRRDFAPGFRAALAHKDLRLALENAAELKLPLPATSLVEWLFRSVEAHHLEDQGMQTILLVLENLAAVSRIE